MSFLRNVLHDLVEKKLWPVAAALIVALIAIPVALGGSADEASPSGSTPVTPSKGALGARDIARAEVVSLEEQALQGKVSRSGKEHNPFEQHHVPKAPDLVKEAAAVVAATKKLVGNGGSDGSVSAGPSTGGTAPSTDTPATSTPTDTTKKPAATAEPEDTYKVALSFGEAGEEKTYDDVARLTPLPSSTNAFLVFLGLKSDGKTAMFLVSSDAVPSGDGKCRPKEDNCETLELKKGDTEFLDLQTGTAGVVQYQITINSISKRKAGSKAKAAAAHLRESKAGREALRATLANDPGVLDGWHFSPDLGVLIERPTELRQDDVAHLPAGLDAPAEAAPAPAAPEFTAGTP